MGRNKKPLPLLEGVTIEAVAAEGKCLFHWQELVVFVPFCVPGDVCDVQIRRKKHSFAEGEVVRFIELRYARHPSVNTSVCAVVVSGRICPTRRS